MLVTDLLLTLTRAFFVLLAVLTAADYLAHRDPIRRDVALVFAALVSTTLVSLFLGITGLAWPWLTKIGQIGLATHPYLLLRLVAYFRPINRRVWWLAGLGCGLSVLTIVGFSAPFPTALTAVIMIYFIGVDGYVVTGFIRGALTSSGVTRSRLRFTAMGSLFLILLFVIAGIRLALPALWVDVTPAVQFMTMVTAITFYLGFTPPRWLLQSWQYTELRHYLLHDIAIMNNRSPAYVLMHLRQAVTRAIGTQQVYVALWDGTATTWTIDQTPEALALNVSQLHPVLDDWDWQARVVLKRSPRSPQQLALLQTVQAEMLFIVPIATSDSRLGALLVFLEYGSLFVDDDLNLLAIFAQQTAVFLENYNVLEQQRRYTVDLEQMVLQRTEALQSSNNDLRQFAYVASHDLQEPLRMVVSYLQLINERYIDKMDDEAREFIGFAIDGGKRMKALIEALLAYSRVETRTKAFTRVDMQKVADEVQKLLKPLIEEKAAAISVDPLPVVQANEAMMIQLLQNLITNGIKYQKNTAPAIRVSVTQQQGEWVFAVCDNGIGIAAKDLDRIFVIFQRLHTGSEYPGTGIGLAVCKKVVEHHGGRIWAESAPGAGTTFYFTLPADQNDAEQKLPSVMKL